MKLAQLKTIVKRGESERLEFKSSTGGLSAGMQTVCAFLNSTHGGKIVFGVKDDGQIVGQIITDKTYKDLATEFNKIEPHVKIDVQYVRVAQDRQAIVVSVEPGTHAPYMYDGRSFIRNQSTTRRMSQGEYIYLYNQKNPTLWENLTTNNCKLVDLDRNRIKEIIRMAVFEKRLPESAISESVPSILKKLKLMVDDKLTNAAVILFCKKESKQFMQSNVMLARFKGINKSEFQDTKTYIANAFDLYDKAMDFLTFSLPIAARIESGKSHRIETPAIPFKVLREALTNALVHRDYSHAGGNMTVAVYDDRVNISNIGALPQGVLLNELSQEHSSIQRNPLIANIFYLCGKIERWGRGTLDMIDDCKSAGNPSPKYEEVGGTFSATLFFKEPIRTIIYESSKKITMSKAARKK